MRGFLEFMLAVLMHLTLPLIPLGFERWFTGSISMAGLAMATSMYAISIGNTTKIRVVFALYFVIGFIFAAAYGYAAGDRANTPPNLEDAATIALLLVFVSHLAERFYRHVIQKEVFWEF
jgi:hypothetical protein